MNIIKRLKAFTLAETLTTLAIIGVITAMTTPVLISKYNEHITVTKLQTFYSTLSNGYRDAQHQFGPVRRWGLNKSSDVWDDNTKEVLTKIFTKTFKIGKNCLTESCPLGENFRSMNGQGEGGGKFVYYLILADGSAISYRGAYDTEKADGKYFVVHYDANGPQGPNIVGNDIFAFFADKNKIVPGIHTDIQYGTENYCLNKSNGWACAPWVIYKGNLDYLHCSNLKWNGQEKCK